MGGARLVNHAQDWYESAMLLRALRKIFSEALALGALAFLCVIAWFWNEDVSFGTTVLLALVVSAIGVTLLVLAVFALMPFQYLRHRRALRREVHKRGVLSDEERQKALMIYRMGPEPIAYRDPRVIPWWEW